MNEQDLIEKLKRIQALRDGATTDGERVAASNAFERMQARLEHEQSHRAVEYKFTMPNHFQRRLFLALARKHGLSPYRYKRQRRTTVMIRVSKQYVDSTLWPEYLSLSDTLHDFLDSVTERVIAEAVHGDQSDAAVSKELTQRD